MEVVQHALDDLARVTAARNDRRRARRFRPGGLLTILAVDALLAERVDVHRATAPP
jgi:hypothetical protein